MRMSETFASGVGRFGVLLLALSSFAAPAQEPAAEARPSVAALAKLASDPDPAARRAAITALGSIGPAAKDALDALAAAAQVEPGAVLRAMLRIDEQGAKVSAVVASLLETPETLDESDWRQLAKAGARLRPALPAMLAALPRITDFTSFRRLARAIRAADLDAARLVAVLLEIAGAPYGSEERTWAAEFLAECDPEGTHSSKELVAMLRSSDAMKREAAATCASRLPTAPPELIDALVDAFLHPLVTRPLVEEPESWESFHPCHAMFRESCRNRLLAALARLGSRARTAAPKLLAQLEREPPAVRADMICALSFIDPDAPAVALAVKAALASDHPGLTCDAIEALGRWSRKAEAVALLAGVLKTSSVHVHPVAAKVLQRIGPEAAGALDELIAMVRRSAESDRRAAVDAIGAIGKGAARAAPALLGILETADPWEFQETLEALDAVVVIPETAADLVAQLAGAKLEGVRLQAAHALGTLAWERRLDGTSSRDAVAALKALLETGSDRCRYMAAHALGRVGPRAASAVEALIETMRREFGPEPGLPEPRAWGLRGQGWAARTGDAAMEALGRIGPAAQAAIAPIERIYDLCCDGSRAKAGVFEYPPIVALERIRGTPQIALSLAVDPKLSSEGSWWRSRGNCDAREPRDPPPLDHEPDGSIKLSLGDKGGGLGGNWVELYLVPDDKAGATVRAVIWRWSDLGPPFTRKLSFSKGSVTLRSADFDRIETICGTFDIDGHQGGFELPNPFRKPR